MKPPCLGRIWAPRCSPGYRQVRCCPVGSSRCASPCRAARSAGGCGARAPGGPVHGLPISCGRRGSGNLLDGTGSWAVTIWLELRNFETSKLLQIDKLTEYEGCTSAHVRKLIDVFTAAFPSLTVWEDVVLDGWATVDPVLCEWMLELPIHGFMFSMTVGPWVKNWLISHLQICGALQHLWILWVQGYLSPIARDGLSQPCFLGAEDRWCDRDSLRSLECG